MKHERGFGLVDLLLAIGSIAVLSCYFFPAVGQTLDYAWGVFSMSPLIQIATVAVVIALFAVWLVLRLTRRIDNGEESF